MTRIAEFPWGWIGSYDDNEIEIVSTIPDPPKVRLAVQAEKVESNLGALSFNLRRADGRHEEYGLVMGRLTADKQEGAIYLALRARGEQAVREVLYLDPHVAIFRVPVQAPASDRLISENGLYELVMQNDRNVVGYDRTTGEVFFASGTNLP